MNQADQIRAFAHQTLIGPGLDSGATSVEVRAGDIHAAMGLQSRMPNVCSALGSNIMLETYGLKLAKRHGPVAGANVVFHFARQSQVADAEDDRPRARDAQRAPSAATWVARGSAYLVSCVKTKGHEVSEARDLYTSDWFRSARRYVENQDARWFILSAQYGLLAPRDMVGPYECTLKDLPTPERRAWAKGVANALLARAPGLDRIVLLAGERYAEFLVPLLRQGGVQIDRPMRGLRQGEQLSWLKRRV